MLRLHTFGIKDKQSVKVVQIQTPITIQRREASGHFRSQTVMAATPLPVMAVSRVLRRTAVESFIAGRVTALTAQDRYAPDRSKIILYIHITENHTPE